MQHFVIRVYALIRLTSDPTQVLITHERYGDMLMTKFPGGGLERGEGIRDCLKRELSEELGIKEAQYEHYYTTEDYVPSAFNPYQQIISVYYSVTLSQEECNRLSQLSFPSKDEVKAGIYTLEWVNLAEIITETRMTFPIDQWVMKKIKSSLFLDKNV
jgi:8-oxo-dGTP pyrophosphatase MutT (NUDIX family)